MSSNTNLTVATERLGWRFSNDWRITVTGMGFAFRYDLEGSPLGGGEEQARRAAESMARSSIDMMMVSARLRIAAGSGTIWKDDQIPLSSMLARLAAHAPQRMMGFKVANGDLDEQDYKGLVSLVDGVNAESGSLRTVDEVRRHFSFRESFAALIPNESPDASAPRNHTPHRILQTASDDDPQVMTGCPSPGELLRQVLPDGEPARPEPDDSPFTSRLVLLRNSDLDPFRKSRSIIKDDQRTTVAFVGEPFMATGPILDRHPGLAPGELVHYARVRVEPRQSLGVDADSRTMAVLASDPLPAVLEGKVERIGPPLRATPAMIERFPRVKDGHEVQILRFRHEEAPRPSPWDVSFTNLMRDTLRLTGVPGAGGPVPEREPPSARLWQERDDPSS